MAYSELIKNFERVRDYMRQFFVFGFKSRNEYDARSARSYDNERRRIESWLGDYMTFRQDASGKNVFLSVDGRNMKTNPLYNAFKAKSFTTGDIVFHFYILDILTDGVSMSIREIMDAFAERYLGSFDDAGMPDESSIRKKLKEYTELGLLKCEKNGRELVYSRSTDEVNLDSWKEAVAFYSEADPLGVIGSFIQDRYDGVPDFFRFKHRYLMHALDSVILCDLLLAIGERRKVIISVVTRRHPDKEHQYNVLPLKIYISTQTGRQYLLAHDYRFRRLNFYRLDGIHEAVIGDVEEHCDNTVKHFERYTKHVWGMGTRHERGLEHLEMTVHADDGECYIADRLEREKRNGTVTRIGEHSWLYSVDCFDAYEMLPWLRTFTGRVEKLECSNVEVIKAFYGDLEVLQNMYGGDGNAVQ